MQQAKAFLTTRKEEETVRIAELLGQILDKPLVVALNGDLGTGKTVFVRGAAAGLGVGEDEHVASPTFVLLKIYQGRLPLYHFDFYRLSAEEDTFELGFEEYLPGDGVAFIEWAGRLPALLPPDCLEITLERFFDKQGGEGRRIWLVPHGRQAADVVEKLFELLSWRTDGALHI